MRESIVLWVFFILENTAVHAVKINIIQANYFSSYDLTFLLILRHQLENYGENKDFIRLTGGAGREFT